MYAVEYTNDYEGFKKIVSDLGLRTVVFRESIPEFGTSSLAVIATDSSGSIGARLDAAPTAPSFHEDFPRAVNCGTGSLVRGS